MSINKINVLNQAKKIFGEDIIKDAYIDVSSDSSENDTEISYKVEDNEIQPSDSCPLVVEFVNGKKIEIWASEWGGVRIK